jgi:hypothetical protein
MLVPCQLGLPQARAEVCLVDLVQGISVVVSSISPQKLPSVILTSQTEIRSLLFGKLL